MIENLRKCERKGSGSLKNEEINKVWKNIEKRRYYNWFTKSFFYEKKRIYLPKLDVGLN